jgi:heme A synthase
VAVLLLVGVTVGLAWLGRYTPSPLPAVTIANVLGGLALIGLLAWMLAHRVQVARRTVVIAAVLAAALALQAADGALISARLAGAACAQPCEHAWLPGAAALWDLARAGSATELLGHRLGGQPLYAVHALTGMALLPLAFVLIAAAGGGPAARRLLMVIGATVAAGVLLNVFESPLWLGVVHAILASSAVAALAVLLASDGQVTLEAVR